MLHLTILIIPGLVLGIIVFVEKGVKSFPILASLKRFFYLCQHVTHTIMNTGVIASIIAIALGVVILSHRLIIRFFKLFLNGLREEPSCGCLFVWLICVFIAIFIPKSSYKSSVTRNHKVSRISNYSSHKHKPYEALPDTIDSVYICTSSSSYAFHVRRSCGALDNCLSYIDKIPVEEALDMGRRRCGRCSKYARIKGD